MAPRALNLSFPPTTNLCVPETGGVLEGQLWALTLTGGQFSKMGMDTLSLNSKGSSAGRNLLPQEGRSSAGRSSFPRREGDL